MYWYVISSSLPEKSQYQQELEEENKIFFPQMTNKRFFFQMTYKWLFM